MAGSNAIDRKAKQREPGPVLPITACADITVLLLGASAMSLHNMYSYDSLFLKLRMTAAVWQHTASKKLQ